MIIAYGLRAQASNALQALRLRLDQVMLAAFLAPADLGWYAAAVMVAGSLSPMTQAVTLVTLPSIASRQGDDAIRRLVGLGRRTLLVLGPAAVALGLLLPWLLPLLLGGHFVASIVPAQILLVGSVFAGLGEVLAEGCRGLNRPGVPVMAEAGALIVATALVAILLPRYGLIGAAVTSSTASAVVYGMLAWHVVTRERTGWRDLLPGQAELRAFRAALSPQGWRTQVNSQPHGRRT